MYCFSASTSTKVQVRSNYRIRGVVGDGGGRWRVAASWRLEESEAKASWSRVSSIYFLKYLLSTVHTSFVTSYVPVYTYT